MKIFLAFLAYAILLAVALARAGHRSRPAAPAAPPSPARLNVEDPRLTVPRADVAGFMLDQLTSNEYVGTAVGVAGATVY